MNKVIHIFVALVFLAFGAVQYNDPDGWKWIIIYLFVALLPISILLKCDKKIFRWIVTIMFLFLLVARVSDVTHWLDAGSPKFIDYEPTTLEAVERIREYLGLLICFLTSLAYLIFYKKGN